MSKSQFYENHLNIEYINDIRKYGRGPPAPDLSSWHIVAHCYIVTCVYVCLWVCHGVRGDSAFIFSNTQLISFLSVTCKSPLLVKSSWRPQKIAWNEWRTWSLFPLLFSLWIFQMQRCSKILINSKKPKMIKKCHLFDIFRPHESSARPFYSLLSGRSAACSCPGLDSAEPTKIK